MMFSVLVLFGVAVTNAQNFQFGAKAGANLASYSNFDVPDNIDKGMRLAFHVGGVAEMTLSEKFALQAELLYSQKGNKYDVKIGDAAQSVLEKLDYITLPIMAKYYIANGLNVHLGPVLGILVSAKKEIYEVSETDIKDQLKSFDYGLGLGGGYEFNSGLFFNIRYVKGFAQLYKENKTKDPKTNNIQVSVGYMF